MGDVLAERITAEFVLRLGSPAPMFATIAADVAREWMEGKALCWGHVWWLRANEACDAFRLIPIEQEDT